MLRSLAFAAAAAYLTISQPELTIAADHHHQGISSPPPYGHGVAGGEGGKSQQHFQPERVKGALVPIAKGSMLVFLSLLSMGLIRLLGGVNRLSSFLTSSKGSKTSAKRGWERPEGVPTGGASSGAAGGSSHRPRLGDGTRRIPDGIGKGCAPPPEGVIIYHAPNPAHALGPEEVAAKIKHFEQLLQYAKECELYGSDSTDLSLGHRLRTLILFDRETRCAGFSADVPLEQIAKFKELFAENEATIRRHFKWVYICT
ncbi:uncharacterized protein EMH_0002410 [Eimeria mitis]|uniref:Uncharacterized protein n=1 Tax=Eimeria mitis TaxID=44415 RepID=U6JXV5_9EIME|nr:uncharacterized protein EMH_0002410 [Eimeria mitis]CDJ28857.1 hypothetical protein EMH_0002410 [Eimeria mitis]